MGKEKRNNDHVVYFEEIGGDNSNDIDEDTSQNSTIETRESGSLLIESSPNVTLKDSVLLCRSEHSHIPRCWFENEGTSMLALFTSDPISVEEAIQQH